MVSENLVKRREHLKSIKSPPRVDQEVMFSLNVGERYRVVGSVLDCCCELDQSKQVNAPSEDHIFRLGDFRHFRLYAIYRCLGSGREGDEFL